MAIGSRAASEVTATQLTTDLAPARRGAIFSCLALMLVYPFFSLQMENAVGRLAPLIGELPARIASEGAIWAFGAVVVCIAVFGERRTLASIGFTGFSVWTVVWGMGAAVVLLALSGAASFLTYKFIRASNHTPAQIEALVRGSLAYALFLALRGGVVEEVLYRGLAIEQITALTGSRGAAALIATLIFVIAHLVHFDLVQLIPIVIASAGFAALYLWRRNIWINIVAHTLIDAIALGAVALHATSLY